MLILLDPRWRGGDQPRQRQQREADDPRLLPGMARRGLRSIGAGFDVTICTNKPRSRGVIGGAADTVYAALKRMLASRNAKVDLILLLTATITNVRAASPGQHVAGGAGVHVAPADGARYEQLHNNLRPPPRHRGANECSSSAGLRKQRSARRTSRSSPTVTFTTTWPPWNVRSWRESSRFEADVVSRPALGRALFGLPIAQRCRPC